MNKRRSMTPVYHGVSLFFDCEFGKMGEVTIGAVDDSTSIEKFAFLQKLTCSN